CGAQAPQAKAQLQEGRRQPGLPDRGRRRRQIRTPPAQAPSVLNIMPRVKIGPAQPDRKTIDVEIARLRDLDVGALRARWHTVFGRRPSPHLRWLDELIADPAANAESIAKREDCTARKVNMTISLAFLAPDLVKAAIDGRLPHGMGVARLCDLPVEWSRQRQMLGLIGQSRHSNRVSADDGLRFRETGFQGP